MSINTTNPYSAAGIPIETPAERKRREDIKYGRDIRQALEAPVNDDWEDIQQFLGPAFCPGCE
jgi:hypothetical protein